MQVIHAEGHIDIVFDESDERTAWRIVAARIKESGATLRDEYIKTVEEMGRLARTLQEEPIVRRRPNGEHWTFLTGADGRLRIEITHEIASGPAAT